VRFFGQKAIALRISGHKDATGMTWGGQIEIASRLVFGYDPMLPAILKKSLNLDDNQSEAVVKDLLALHYSIPYQVLPLQDCVDLALLLIRTTINAQALAVGTRGVGGMIEVATITRTGKLDFVQRKKIRGEHQTGRG